MKPWQCEVSLSELSVGFSLLELSVGFVQGTVQQGQ